MLGLAFEQSAAVVASAPLRTDIACFVGFVRRRPGRTLPGLGRWLAESGWTGRSFPDVASAPASVALTDPVLIPPEASEWRVDLDGAGAGADGLHPLVLPVGATPRAEFMEALRGIAPRLQPRLLEDGCLALTAGGDSTGLSIRVSPHAALGFPRETVAQPGDTLPVPIDSWEAFESLFDWNARPLNRGGASGPSLLGVAVRSFFAQGGRKCYVVRVGDPWPVLTPRALRDPLWSRVLPRAFPPSPADRGSWQGLGHLFGLPDVSFVCVPDLPDLVSADAVAPTPGTEPPPSAEVFAECSELEAPGAEFRAGRAFRAPRCDEDGFGTWARHVAEAGAVLAARAREVQFIAAVPLVVADAQRAGPAETALRGAVAGVRTAFVQLACPWVRTPGSDRLPEGLEPPDGILAGVLARSALARGAFHSAARQPLLGVIAVEPVPGPEELQRELTLRAGKTRALMEHISVLGPTPAGWCLISDVTTAGNEAYRPANINRLVSALVRAARELGEALTFESSGEALWARLRSGIEDLLGRLWQEGALAGATAAEAFDVRCDRTTMTQNDLDAGRVVAQVRFMAAAPIERITVVLSVDEGGQVSVRPADAAGVEQP